MRFLRSICILVLLGNTILAALEQKPPENDRATTPDTDPIDVEAALAEPTKLPADHRDDEKPRLDEDIVLAEDPIPVVVWNRTVTHVRIGWGEITAADRARIIAGRITALDESDLYGEIEYLAAKIGDIEGIMFYCNDRNLFGLALDDLTPEERADLKATAEKTKVRLREIFDARLDQRRPQVILYGILWSIVATALLIVFVMLILSLHRRVQNKVTSSSFRIPPIAGIDISPVLKHVIGLLIRIPMIAGQIFLVYLWATTILSLFPYTRPLAEGLGEQLLAVLGSVGHGVAMALPDIFMLLVIFFCFRLVIRALNGFLSTVEEGELYISWMQPETARATRRIATILICLFAMTVAYPYIPGSGSEAFKGISVFAGLLLTLGSAGVVNQVMSGLVVIYARAMKQGDLIKVGELVGTVQEQGFLSTKLLSPMGHEVTVPNALLTSNSVHNYTKANPIVGFRISTSITIGYDTPWRQVHELLKVAARRCEGVVAGKSEVFQMALSDWYVQYEIRCVIKDVNSRIDNLSDLHANIQDVFAEHGIQIMSPNYVAQPDAEVLPPPHQRDDSDGEQPSQATT